MTGVGTVMNKQHRGAAAQPDTVANQAFGFWLYLMSDLVLFASVFATYAVLAESYAGGPTGKDLFDLTYTFAETIFLLVSSAAYGLVMVAMHHDGRRAVLAGLAATFGLGLGFVSMEINEFQGLVAHGNGPQRSAYLSAFFTLVGTHGAHVIAGLVWMAVTMVQVAAKGLTTAVRARLLRLAMFWHFLDIVWVGVFSVVYLMGVG